MKKMTGSMWKSVALAVVLAFVFAACGKQALITTEKVLATTGRQFTDTGAMFNRMCALGAQPAMDAKTCAAWKEFVPEFQEVFAEANVLWNDLAACELAKAKTGDARDCGSKAEIVATTLSVTNTLANYAFKVIAAIGVQHQGGAR